MALIKVEDALARLLDGIAALGSEEIPLANGYGRILAADLVARRSQPPFNASAMDGYAVKAADIKDLPTRLQVIGEIPAGSSFPDEVQNWEAVRIFTGAPVPKGADSILIQENAERDGAFVSALEPVTEGQHIRLAGMDFKEGEVQIKAGTKLEAPHLALAASMNHPTLPVVKRPKVAILATGSELVLPGQQPSPDQIVASNNYGVAALVQAAGGEVLDLGIAPDDMGAITAKVEEARAAKADILVTSGGVSVGDHDLVQDVLQAAGMELNFWRVAMRPGKPIMVGKLDDIQVVGLPGNPVSAMVCAILFLTPLVRKMRGDATAQLIEAALLGGEVKACDKRQTYLRASLTRDNDGHLVATPFTGQDSAMLTGFAKADCLIIRPPFAEIGKAGEACKIIRL